MGPSSLLHSFFLLCLAAAAAAEIAKRAVQKKVPSKKAGKSTLLAPHPFPHTAQRYISYFLFLRRDEERGGKSFAPFLVFENGGEGGGVLYGKTSISRLLLCLSLSIFLPPCSVFFAFSAQQILSEYLISLPVTRTEIGKPK